MAEETEEAKEGGEKSGGGGGLKAILIPVLASAVVSAVIGAVFTFVLAPQPEIKQDEIDRALQEASTQADMVGDAGGGEVGKQTGIFHNYDPFIVSIFDREKVHYLKVVLSLELSAENVKDAISAKNPQIRDAMIFVLSDFTLRELLDNQAKNLLKEVMVKTLNKILGKGKITNIYFTEFTIQ